MSLALLLAAALQAQAPAKPVAAPMCRAVLQGANVWNGTAFVKRDLSFDKGRFTAVPAAGAPVISASYLYLAPPLVDAHTHTIDTPTGPDDKAHAAALKRGIFYANLSRPVVGMRAGRVLIDQVGLLGPACAGGAAR